MKWLILLTLIACGKHEEPNKLDLRDSDGDQVLNHQESELEKYVADIEPLGKVQGVMKLNLDKIIEIPFSNELDIKNNALSLIVSNEDRLKHEEYFSEWSKLRFSGNLAKLNLTSSHYLIHLQFESGSDKAQELVLKHGTETILLGEWSEVMKIQLSAQNLSSLLEGTSFLSLRKKFQKSPLFEDNQDGTIREKTYRVHFFDGKKSKILYVARSLAFPDLLKLMNIKAKAISEDELFFNSDLVEAPRWYMRELKTGGKVIVFSDLEKLNEKILENYIYHKEVLSRVNGKASSTFHFNNPENAKIFVRISSAKYTQRTFIETKKRRTHGGGGGGGREGNANSGYRCTHYLRNIKKEQSYSSNLQDVFVNLGQEETIFNSYVEEEMSEKGVFWEMKLNQPAPNLAWQFINRPSSTYTVTGEYRNSCGDGANRGRGAAYSTNTEGKFEVVIESYVEKIP